MGRGLFVALAGSGLLVGACNAVSGLGDYEVVASGSGAAGAGSAVGGAGTGGGSGGAGAGCTVASDCQGSSMLCEAAACDDGACGIAPIAGGEPSWQQTAGDCRVVVCDAAGSTESQIDAMDLPDDGKACTLDLCESGIPSNPLAPAGVTCDEEGGSVCDAMGTCVECIDNAGCPTGSCQAGLCVPSTCIDAVKNGLETDVDCGGGRCAPCGDGLSCGVATDCVNQVCAGTCQPPTCVDGVENGAESDVDCGGGGCPACNPGLGCSDGSGCTSGVCVGGICQSPTCSDAVKNGSETATDCGGGGCPPCGTGLACNVDADCASAFCQGGQCVPSIVIQVDGHAPVAVPCTVGDHDCQGQWVCNKVTNSACIYQQYDCYFGNTGSWYPPDGQSGSSNFNFAIAYDFQGAWGNICACNQNQMAVYGLGIVSNPGCATGHWARQ